MATVRKLLDPKRLPAWHRRILREECGGDWGRVTEDGDGNYLVHNSEARARAWVDAAVPVVKSEVRQRRVEPVQHITPGVNVVPADRSAAEERERQQARRLQWTKALAGEPDWSRFDVMATASEILESLRGGLPGVFRVGYHPEVLALQGLDIGQVEAALRRPQYVEIRPESGEKKYPILGFRRGDVFVILGMRTPTSPIVIAAYWSSLLDSPTGRPFGQRAATGGGGSKKSAGLPTSPRALVTQLRARGGYVPENWELADKAVDVSYRGQDLGKITVGPGTGRKQVQTDYQRVVRKMQAIDRRLEAAAV